MEYTTEVLLETDSAEIYQNEDLNTIFFIYKKPVNDHNEIVELHQKFISFFKKLSTNKFVVDIRLLGAMPIESQKWIADVLFPALLEHLDGRVLYHFQFMGKEIFAKVAAKAVKQRTEKEQQLSLEKEPMIIEQYSDWDKMIERLKEIK